MLSSSGGHHSILFDQGFQKISGWDWLERHLMVLCINEIVPSYVVMSLNFVKSRKTLLLVQLLLFSCISCYNQKKNVSAKSLNGPFCQKKSVKSHNLWHFSHELSLRARLRGLNRSQKSCDLQSLTLYTPKWAIIGCPFLHCSLHQWFLCTLVKNTNLRMEFNKIIFHN